MKRRYASLALSLTVLLVACGGGGGSAGGGGTDTVIDDSPGPIDGGEPTDDSSRPADGGEPIDDSSRPTDSGEPIDDGSGPTGSGDRADNDGVDVGTRDTTDGIDAEGFGRFDCGPDAAPADADGDGLGDCEEIGTHRTNPLQSDTDGDGFTDRDEVVVFDPLNDPTRFNPRVADLARIAIELTSVPDIELRYQDSEQQTRSVSTAHGASDSSGLSRNWGGETSRQLEVGHTVSANATSSVSTSVDISVAGLGGSTSLESSLSVGFGRNRTQTVGSTVNWSSTQSAENTRTFEASEELGQTAGTTFTGGTLSVTARVVNDGQVAYDLENLTLTAFLFDPARPFDLTPIRNLEFSAGSFPTTSIVTGSQSAPLNFSAELSLPQARELLRDSRNLVIEPATFRLVNRDDRSILLSDQEVNARTATVTIDFGRQEDAAASFRVAVGDGSGSRSITALDALQDVLGLDVTEGRGQWIFGDEGAPRDAFEGVLSIGRFSISSETNSYWLGAVSGGTGALGGGRSTRLLNLLDGDYRLSDIDLRAGDTLSLVYVTDTDRDALPDRHEREFGTDRQLPDSDGDSVGDAEEIYGITTNLDGPPCDVGPQFLVTSDPLNPDTDGDGFDDGAERLACTNPSLTVIADAGLDQIVDVGTRVTLSGAAEGLFDGLPQYSWSLVSGPDLTLDGEAVRTLDGRAPTFTAPERVSTLVFDLEVTVDGVASPADRMVVQVQQERDRAVYVGLDASGEFNIDADGTRQSPYPSIEEALNGIDPGDDLYVMTPTLDGEIVPYVLTNGIVVPVGTDLFGAYDNDWVRDVTTRLTPLVLDATRDFQAVLRYEDMAAETRLSGFSLMSRASGGTDDLDLVALSVDGTADATFIAEHNRFEADTPSLLPTGANFFAGSSYAAHIANLGRLSFRDNVLSAGRGSDGKDGGAGGNGEAGRPGGNARGIIGGAPGDSGYVNALDAAGIGGRGASSGANFLRGGDGGAPGVGGARPGQGGAGGDVPRDGGVGGDGADGDYIPNAGLFDPTEPRYVKGRGASGRRGNPGAGGGGGGGGSASYVGLIRHADGGAGGGGGEGGSHGFGGAAGANGGASIGLWLHAIGTADVRDNRIGTADGGHGGDGGPGGSGAPGGRGGQGAPGVDGGLIIAAGADGADGGAGGRGGDGSDGGGGSGGPSIGVLVGTDVSATLSGNVIATGDGGDGGSVGSTGNGGESVGIFDATPDDGDRARLSGNTFEIGTAGSAGTMLGPEGVPGRDGCAGDTRCR